MIELLRDEHTMNEEHGGVILARPGLVDRIEGGFHVTLLYYGDTAVLYVSTYNTIGDFMYIALRLCMRWTVIERCLLEDVGATPLHSRLLLAAVIGFCFNLRPASDQRSRRLTRLSRFLSFLQ